MSRAEIWRELQAVGTAGAKALRQGEHGHVQIAVAKVRHIIVTLLI